MNQILLFIILLMSMLSVKARAGVSANPLLSEGRRELGPMKSSTYRHKTSVDESSGRFDFDCSGFLDYAIARVDRNAYSELPISKPKSARPLAEDYFKVFANPVPGTSQWISISRAIELLPGDIVAWLIPSDSKSKDTGHMMLVAEPVKINPDDSHQVWVTVIDSAASGHSADSRSKNQSGLGNGTITIVNDANNEKAIGLYWRANESKKVKFTQIAFGRLKNAHP